ncbi:MAG TPA: hypothetical protein VGR55_01320 [Candidatus Acidoferrum sp.]|nr:hypothetical protein [Candidatus Acidoferrum sp.]
MSFVNDAFNAAFPQVQQAENTATQIAYAVAVWGFIVTVELGVLIYFASRGKK